MATFAEALPGLQAQGYTNIMDALAAYNAANAASYFIAPAPVPAPAPAPEPMFTAPAAPAATPAPVVSAPVQPTYTAPVVAAPAPAPAPTPAPSGMLMPSISVVQTNRVVDEAKNTLPNLEDRIDQISKIYQETLGRSPDISGLLAYASSDKSLETIKRDMAYSPEGQTLIKAVYNNTLGRDPDASGLKTYTEFLAKEKPYIESYGNSEIEALKTELKISPEGQVRNPDPAAAELARIYKEYAGRDLDASGYAYFKGALTGPDAAAGIAEAIRTGDEAELRTRLGRQPTAQETQDYMQQRDRQRAAEGRQFGNFVKSVLPIALNFAVPGLGASIGASLGLTGVAAQAVGNAIVSGVVSGITTGDAERGLVTGALAGLGTAAVSSGAVGNIMNNIGLGDVATSLNIPTSTTNISGIEGFGAAADQVGGAGAGGPPVFTMNTPSGMLNIPTGGTPGFEGIDLSTQLAGGTNIGGAGAINTGGFGTALPSVANLTQSLINAGISPGTAQNLAGATLAGLGGVGGATVGLLTTGLTPTGPAVPTPTTTPTPTPTTTPTTTPTPNLTSLLPAATSLFPNLNLGGLVGAGIDFAQLQALQREATGLGRELSGEAARIGREGAIPFTPYTVTTGAGVGTVRPGEATAVTSPEMQALRQQQLGLAGQAFGAVNPAQAAEALFQRQEALAAPGRAREQEALLGSLRQRGLLGFGVNQPTVGGDVRTVSPLMESLLSAQETARAQQALQAQQFGTQEAIRQAGLGQGLVTGAQGIDQQTLAALNAAATLGQQERAVASRNQLLAAESALQGLRMRAPYEQLGLQARGTALAGVGGATRGLFGLPTQQGNVLGNLTLSQLFGGGRTATSPLGEGTGPQYQFQDYGIFF